MTPPKTPLLPEIMSPNTRQRKSRCALKVTQLIKTFNFQKDDQIDILNLCAQQLELKNKVDYVKPTKGGRKMVSFETRQAIWDYWHAKSTPSTLTSRPAKLKMGHKAKIQSGLKFVDVVNIIKQRGKEYYQGNWRIINITFRELYHSFINTFPINKVSLGTFYSLKPFYVRSATTNNIEMCCCKLHLHARWALKALIECCKMQNIDLQGVNCYETFFKKITEDCASCVSTYIDWSCVTSTSQLCEHIQQNWDNFLSKITSQADDKVTVSFMHFEKVDITTRAGKVVSHLKSVVTPANANFIINFLSNLLPKFINHRNHLKHYRSTIKILREQYDLFLDIDFSENLSVPIKYEPQSCHWSHDQVTVHSGILKHFGLKQYHPYLSNDKKHDQKFVKVAIEKMLDGCNFNSGTYCVIESDNCSSQYKSAQHFTDMQEIADKNEIKIIRVYGVAGHGKGEVDHVGGLAKVTVRREIAAGALLTNAKDMVNFLNEKYSHKDNPKYVIKEITQAELEKERTNTKVFNTIQGSSKFQVILFSPFSSTIKAAPRLCICELCREEYGQCSVFEEYLLNVSTLTASHIRSDNKEFSGDEVSVEGSDFLLPGTVCAIAADRKSVDTVWFFEIVKEFGATVDIYDDYGVTVGAGQRCLEGHFFELLKVVGSTRKYKLILSKKALVYRESVVYPFVPFEKKDDCFVLLNNDFVDILRYVEHNGLEFI